MFGVPLDYFFAGINALSGHAPPPAANGDAVQIAGFAATAEGLELLRAYLAVDEPGVRRKIMALLKTLGRQD